MPERRTPPARRSAAAQKTWLEETHAAVILLDDAGKVVQWSARARELFAEYCQSDDDSVLDRWVAGWLQSIDADTPNALTIAAPQGLLRVRVLALEAPDNKRVLLVDEQRAAGSPSTNSLRALGLTGRQAEVLRLLALGYSTQRIAEQLYLSPATVRKHLEHIYERLGVTSRTEAVAVARHR